MIRQLAVVLAGIAITLGWLAGEALGRVILDVDPGTPQVELVPDPPAQPSLPRRQG